MDRVRARTAIARNSRNVPRKCADFRVGVGWRSSCVRRDVTNSRELVCTLVVALAATRGLACGGDEELAAVDGTSPAADAGAPANDARAPDVDGGLAAPDASGEAPLPPPVPYANPVLAHDFADPTVIRGKDRKLYAFATGGLIQRAESTDLVHWKTIGDALAAKPSWASAKNAFWAPHVVEHAGTYFLYFSAEQNAGTGSFCVGVAKASGPDQPFVDTGTPIVCGPSFVNIDPMVYVDPKTGKPLLYWGSGFEAIRVQELAPDRVRFAPGSKPTSLLVPSSNAYERLIEGAWLHEHAGTFYLFFSGDDCCGSANAPPHYAVMVSRAKSAVGPFEDFGPSTGAPDNTILVGNARWLGPGHNAVVVDDAGTEWMVYHSFDTKQPGGRMLMIDPIRYVNGWPSIAGRSPSEGLQKDGPVFRP